MFVISDLFVPSPSTGRLHISASAFRTSVSGLWPSISLGFVHFGSCSIWELFSLGVVHCGMNTRRGLRQMTSSGWIHFGHVLALSGLRLVAGGLRDYTINYIQLHELQGYLKSNCSFFYCRPQDKMIFTPHSPFPLIVCIYPLQLNIHPSTFHWSVEYFHFSFKSQAFNLQSLQS